MKKLTLATIVLAASAFSAISAQAHQAEVGATYNLLDVKHGSNLNQFGTKGVVYFQDVNLKDSPLNEAAFLDRASNVNAGITYAKKHDFKLNTYSVGVDYFIPNSNFFVGANVAHNETRVDVHTPKVKTNAYAAEVGYLPINGLLLAVGAQGYKVAHSKDDGIDPTFRAKYVTSLPNGKDVNVEAKAVFGKDYNRQYYVGADYYFDKTFSAGIDYSKAKAIDLDQVGLRAKKFFDQNFSVEGRVGFGSDYNTYTIGANYRF